MVQKHTGACDNLDELMTNNQSVPGNLKLGSCIAENENTGTCV